MPDISKTGVSVTPLHLHAACGIVCMPATHEQGHGAGAMQSIRVHILTKPHPGAQTAGCTAAKKGACAAQVVDEQQGPRTRKEYTIAHVPVGAGGAGQVVDFLIRPLDAQLNVVSPSAASLRAATAPLLGTAPDMDAREQICEPLTTGVKVRRPAAALLVPSLLRSQCKQ